MNKQTYPLILSFSILSLLCACSTSKKANQLAGDNKEYKNEDSTSTIKTIEKSAKMPFDTVSTPFFDTK
jgi:hypothetical protein